VSSLIKGRASHIISGLPRSQNSTRAIRPCVNVLANLPTIPAPKEPAERQSARRIRHPPDVLPPTNQLRSIGETEPPQAISRNRFHGRREGRRRRRAGQLFSIGHKSVYHLWYISARKNQPTWLCRQAANSQIPSMDWYFVPGLTAPPRTVLWLSAWIARLRPFAVRSAAKWRSRR